MMSSMGQGLGRIDKRKQKKEVAISKMTALAQYVAAIMVCAGLVVFSLYCGLQYIGSSVPVSSLAQSQERSDLAAQQMAIIEENQRRILLNADALPANFMQAKPATVLPACRIVVNVPSRTLDFYNANRLVKTYLIAVGKPFTPTPLGNFSITQKEVNPWWYPPRRKIVVPSGPSNPLGYRWMGFAPLYGIHGTNTPWEVGGSMSNGCIRMYEEDVEELFEQVPYGTTVEILYDLVRVEVSPDGRVSLGIYPDIYRYHRQSVTVAEVQQKLKLAGVQGFVSEEFVQDVASKQGGRQVAMLQVHKLKVDGKIVPAQVVTSQGRVFVPVWAVVGALKVTAIWDEQKQQMSVGDRAVHGMVKGDLLYVAAEDIQSLFGGIWLWQQADNCWELITVKLGKN